MLVVVHVRYIDCEDTRAPACVRPHQLSALHAHRSSGESSWLCWVLTLGTQRGGLSGHAPERRHLLQRDG